MGMVATFQQVPQPTLNELIRTPARLEDFLFAERDDSYTFDGYGDLQVDVSESRMAAWSEIHRRVQGLGGEMMLANGAAVPMTAVEIQRDVTKWRHPETGDQQQRAHAGIASLRLTLPLGQRLRRTKHRVGDFTLSAVLVALPLSFLCLYLQKTYGLPPWSWAALMIAIAGVVLWQTVAIFRRERLVVTYRSRRSRASRHSRPEPMDIDKAWEPIEAAIARMGRDEATAVRDAISGGHEIEKSEIGYGPASYLTAEEVVNIASSLSRISAEAVGEKCEPELREYVVSHLRNLQSYYRDAAEHGHAMIRYYC